MGDPYKDPGQSGVVNPEWAGCPSLCVAVSLLLGSFICQILACALFCWQAHAKQCILIGGYPETFNSQQQFLVLIRFVFRMHVFISLCVCPSIIRALHDIILIALILFMVDPILHVETFCI